MTSTVSNTNLFQERCRNAQAVMAEQNVDYLFIGPGADLHYLIGTPGMENERMMLFVIPRQGDPVMIVPALEKLATSKYATFFELLDWKDSDGPQGRLSEVLGKAGKAHGAVGNHLWSMFTLELQKVMPDASWSTASQVLKKLRVVKSAKEVQLLKDAAAVADKTFSELVNLQFSGRSERELMGDINNLLLKYGQEQMLFCIVGSGPNGAQPHHHTGDRVIQPGDVVVLDFGGSYKGYCSDMTRTVLVEGGQPDSDFEKVYNIVNEARAAGHRQARPGVSCESVDAASREVITRAGYGEYFVHRTGHGIGMEVHEDPYIVGGNNQVLEPGMAFSIEPGIYLPGRFGVRIEDIAVVTENGEENIDLSTHEIVRVK
ncbi:MAG TPA: aminopeptidase P family protein [Chloroflexia bacterium]|nr:aminopeptidase P family protein [Chloroflexia bacterium]